jgi:O-antigen biosynthesis protein WbqV
VILGNNIVLPAVKFTVRTLLRVGAVFAAYFLALRYEFTRDAISQVIDYTWLYALTFAVVGAAVDWAARTDRALWRYISVPDAVRIIRASAISVAVFLVIVFVFERALTLPRSALIVVFVLDAGLALSMALARRILHDSEARRELFPFFNGKQDGTAVVLVGGVERADAFLRELAREPEDMQPVGIVGGDLASDRREVRGVRLIPDLATAADLLDSYIGNHRRVAVVFLDDSMTPSDFGAERLGHLRAQGLKLWRKPSITEIGEGDGAVLCEFQIEELLARPPVNLNREALKSLIAGQRVLVTGAGGSIGSEIARQVAGLGCAHLVLIDSSEFNLFTIDQEICDRWPSLSRSEYLHNVRNQRLVTEVFQIERPDIVFHAAALKHVPLMERHPCEAVLTNILGTWNVAAAANETGAKHMVFISTDKAVAPPNVMGATKRLAEAIIRGQQKAKGQTRFSVVRFGNVLGSAGSVVPTFRAQIDRGGPLTLTHPDIERYFMTIPEAVQLVLHATAHSSTQAEGPLGVMLLDMGKPVKIIDLARQLIRLAGKIPDRDIKIEVTGLRPGEKLSEDLIDSGEVAEVCAESLMRVTDRFEGKMVTGRTVATFERLARSGEDAAVRKLLFDTLDAVRGDESRSRS